MIVLLANSALVVLGSAVLAMRLPVGPGMRVVAALLVMQAWITAVLLAAGAGLRTLDAAAVSAVNVVILGLVAVACRNVIRLLPAQLAALGARRRPAVRGLIGLGRREPAAAVAALVVGAAVLWKLVQALRLPVLDFDGFSYHLVTVDVWLQSGAIGRVPQRIWSDGYPANGELVTLWLMTFTRSDLLANLTAWLALPLAMAATAGLARNLGATRARSVLSGLLIGGTPAVLALSASTYVDLWAMADVAAAACFAVLALRMPGSAGVPVVLAGMAIGLAVGTKASMAIPTGAIALALVIAALRGRSGAASRARAAVQTGLLVAVPAIGLGGYWYAKNLIVFGDPFWPFNLGPFRGVGDFRMITQTPAALVGDPGFVAILRSWFADVGLRLYQYDTRIGGFGVVWALVLVLAVVGLLRLRPALRWPVALIGGAMLVTLLTMPMGWWPRLTLFIVVPAVALAAVGLSRLTGPSAGIAAAAVVLLMSWSVFLTVGRSNLLVLPGGRTPPSAISLARIMAADDPDRRDLGLWATCSTITGLPAGASVVADAFSLVHAIVGHELERQALPPVEMSSDPVVLRDRLHDAGATHVVLGPSSPGLPAANARPDLFQPLGATCREAQVFALAGASPPVP